MAEKRLEKSSPRHNHYLEFSATKNTITCGAWPRKIQHLALAESFPKSCLGAAEMPVHRAADACP
jgi:hypothetical protein